MRKLFSLALFIFILILSSSLEAKNVILMIGDGMGTSMVTAARFYKDPTGSKDLFIDTLPLVAHVKTLSQDQVVTDSAAAITAMATGTKTTNGCLNYGPKCDEKNRLKIITEMAAQAGYAVGIVTTTHVTHATPAGFYAHVKDRNDKTKIAAQLLTSNIALALGGGKQHFSKKKAAQAGLVLVEKLADIKNVPPGKRVLGLLAYSHLPHAAGRQFSLADMTAAAIERLQKNKKGFLLLVESGRIDHAAHENATKETLQEVLEFDHTIKKVVEMTAKTDTLVLVTADHETGGLAINGYPKRGESILGHSGRMLGTYYPILSWATGPNAAYETTSAAHTGVDIPLYATGRGHQSIPRGTIDNTQIFHIMKQNLPGLK